MRFVKLLLFLFILVSYGTSNAVVSTLIADTKSGFVLASQNASVQQPPASLTKLMTLYLTFSALDKGLLSMDDKLPISKQAVAQPRSKLYLKEGDTITVREAVMALIIKSANDVAVVVAEALAQDEDRFAELMTRTAHGLGLKDTFFKNASGLHCEGQVSTARDMAILTMALITHYPKYYDLFSAQSFTYNGKTYYSHNNVLQQYEGAEGLKTGFVSAVGYNIISTAKQGDSRLVSVVIGEDNQNKRDLRAMRLLDKGFQQVAVQQKAQAEGRLKSAFNPLNRKAFISRPPEEIFLPTMMTCVPETQKKVKQLALAPKLEIPVQSVINTDIPQGDGWSIQVGAFEGQEKARQTAQKALDILGLNKEIKTPRANERFFRSRIKGFGNKQEASNACRRLKDARWQCFEVAP
jgi:D-alanyl-D-alanine carboxypeptidase